MGKEKFIGKGIDPVAFVAKEGYPEVGRFAVAKDLQRFYKKLDTKVLEDWAAIEGATYTPCPEQPAIHRMRVAMAILYKHFPPVRKGKPVSVYAAYSLEQLMELAIERDVAVEPTDDERIMRMRTIMALKDAKVIDPATGAILAEAK